MKRIPIAAAALLFGTSAYAMVPPTERTGVQVDKDHYTATNTSLNSATDVSDPQPAAMDSGPVAYTPVAYRSDEAKAKEVELADASDAVDAGDKSDAAIGDEPDLTSDSEQAFETAAAEVEEPAPVKDGIGGPYEGIDAGDLTSRPAAQNYPACSPGPGDDNCIQLYEQGVRQQLSVWDQPTGGFAGEAQVAMGGPYEAADDATLTHEAAMHGDGTVDTAMGEAAKDEPAEG